MIASTDMSIGCISSVTNDAGVSTPVTAPDVSACVPAANMPDAGSGTTPQIQPFGFVVEGPKGDVVVATLFGQGSIKDSDPFSPGGSGVPVGRLPVSIATTADGCYAVTANSGSCDIGVVNIVKAASVKSNSATQELLHTTAGDLAARPLVIATPPSLPATTKVTCGDKPSGQAYLDFPGCQLVARVDLATGNVLDGVQFDASGVPSIVGP